MTLADNGDRLHTFPPSDAFRVWVYNHWPEIAVALRERDELVDWKATALVTRRAMKEVEMERDALRVRAETAEAWRLLADDAIQAHLHNDMGGQDDETQEFVHRYDALTDAVETRDD